MTIEYTSTTNYTVYPEKIINITETDFLIEDKYPQYDRGAVIVCIFFWLLFVVVLIVITAILFYIDLELGLFGLFSSIGIFMLCLACYMSCATEN